MIEKVHRIDEFSNGIPSLEAYRIMYIFVSVLVQ
jgi:hypothetical protein